jgi:indole-3-glycerol phosphate synthase
MSILDQIVEATRTRVRKQKQEVPIRELEDQPLFGHPRQSLHDALSKHGISVIAEIKRASPSKGILRASVDPSQVASTYEMNGAAAVSVLTEPDYFQGSLEDLRAAREAASIPILRKDFVVDPYQLLEARAYGADAVLLIASVLDRSHLTDLLQAAGEIGIDHLVEVYRERELDRIDFSLVRTVGANNRDLDTFEVDVERAAKTLRHVPAGILRVAESGIASRKDVLLAAEGGADAVLVGETLMRAKDPGMELRSLLSDSEIEIDAAESHRNPE